MGDEAAYRAADEFGQAAGRADQVRLLFDIKAATWSAKYAPDGPHAGRLTRFSAAADYHVPAGGRVLDLGCGTGELARHLAGAGWRVQGCDISPEMLGRASAHDPSGTVDWVQLEPGWQRMPFDSATFDAVVASSVLEYADWPTVILRECARVLHPHGVVLCTVPDPTHPIRWVEWLASVAARLPLSRAMGARWPRLDGYLTYLRLSRQRHRAGWWCAVAAQAGLLDVSRTADSAEHSPLRLLTFQRPGPPGVR